MNKRHLTYCLFGLAIVLAVVVGVGSANAVPWAFFLLVCPLMMGGMMWMMMRGMDHREDDHQHTVGHH